LSWFPNYNREVINANLRTAYPNLSEAEYHQKTLQTLQQNTMAFTELGAIWGWPIERVLPLIKQVHGEHLIAEAFEKNKGLVMLSPHFGCWDIITIYLTQNYDFTFLYQPPKEASIEAYISQVRTRTGGAAAPATG